MWRWGFRGWATGLLQAMYICLPPPGVQWVRFRECITPKCNWIVREWLETRDSLETNDFIICCSFWHSTLYSLFLRLPYNIFFLLVSGYLTNAKIIIHTKKKKKRSFILNLFYYWQINRGIEVNLTQTFISVWIFSIVFLKNLEHNQTCYM